MTVKVWLFQIASIIIMMTLLPRGGVADTYWKRSEGAYGEPHRCDYFLDQDKFEEHLRGLRYRDRFPRIKFQDNGAVVIAPGDVDERISASSMIIKSNIRFLGIDIEKEKITVEWKFNSIKKIKINKSASQSTSQGDLGPSFHEILVVEVPKRSIKGRDRFCGER